MNVLQNITSTMAFSVQERIKCVGWYIANKSVTATQRLFRTTYGRNKSSPTHKTILKWHQKFISHGTVEDTKHTRPIRIDTIAIINHFRINPKTSQKRASNALNISKSSVQQCLKKNKFHPYKLQIVQQLNVGDYAARVAFAEEILHKIANSPDYLRYLMFSDEAHFHLDGAVNRHNCRYWSDENPKWIAEKPLHSPRTTVWAAIWSSGVIGPFFIDENVTSERYLKMLIDEFWPSFNMLQHTNSYIFMQDGAPPHWARTVRQWLNDKFPNRWIGRGGVDDSNIRWPPRSPDLTPCDFFLWGFLKQKVYTTRPQNLDELKVRIKAAFQLVNNEMLHRTLDSFKRRLELILENDGHHIEC